MSKFAVARNVTDSPVTIDDDGRTLGGGEWRGDVRHQTQLVRDLVDAGRIVVHPSLEDSESLSPEARAAVRQAAELNSAETPDEPDGEPKAKARR